MSFKSIKQHAKGIVTDAFFDAADYVHTDASEHDCKIKLKRDQQVITSDGSYMVGDVIDVTLGMTVTPTRGGAFILNNKTYEIHQSVANNGSRASYIVKLL